MTNDIAVTEEGFVHVGKNNWVSLQAIQQAVSAKVGPTRNCQCDSDDESAALLAAQRIPTRRPAVNSEEHLPLPTMDFRKPAQKRSQPQQTLNTDEHLPLPTMNFTRDADDGGLLVASESAEEHLIPPSTARRR
jgi:hypothetical protein